MDLVRKHPNLEPVLKLKCHDPEHFDTLCKMHLSFLLDLHDDEFSDLLQDLPTSSESKAKKTFSYFKKAKSGGKQVMDGAPLTQEGICQVYQLIQYLNSNLNTEGLFRKSGSLSRQQELKALLNLGQAVQLGQGSRFSVHDCAGVLKSFLAALPQPLLLHWRLHLGLCEQQLQAGRRLQAVGLLVLLLPAPHLGLLHDLLALLHRAATQAAGPCTLDVTGLATLFAPHLLLPRRFCPEALQSHFPQLVDAMVFLISNAHQLFEPLPELLEDIRTHLQKHAKFLSQLGSPAHGLEPVSTVVTFCQPGGSADITQQAVAQLYAHIQSLPDSSRKRRLLRQANKENRPHRRSKSVGIGLRCRLYRPTFHKSKDDSLIISDLQADPQVTLHSSSPLPTTPSPKPPPESPLKPPSHGTPFSRTLTRASKRVKAAVMAPRNKTPITT